jgi:glycopeptide antibiotics resistance protein
MFRPTFRIAKFAPTLATLYLAVLIFLLLRPFEFASPDSSLENNVEWWTVSAGVQFNLSAVLHGGAPLLLKKPVRIPKDSRPFFSFIIDTEGKLTLIKNWTMKDVIRNFVLFVPFGAFGFAWLERRIQSSALAILIAAVCAGLVSATFEALQLFLPSRESSISDLGANAIGAIVGAAGCWYWFVQAGKLQRTGKPVS